MSEVSLVQPLLTVAFQDKAELVTDGKNKL